MVWNQFVFANCLHVLYAFHLQYLKGIEYELHNILRQLEVLSDTGWTELLFIVQLVWVCFLNILIIGGVIINNTC